MVLDEFGFNIENIELGRGYWFIRTDSGSHFDFFVSGGYIGIGWDLITKDDILNTSYNGSEVKFKIADKYFQIEGFDRNSSSGKRAVTSVYNKLYRFNNLKYNDLIIIPSRNSNTLAFGRILDNEIYSETKPSELHNCTHIKRRKVEWIKIVNLSDLDSIFYQVIQSRHAIFDIKKYEKYIDNVTNSVYIKGGVYHLVLDIETEDQIKINALLDLFNSMTNVIENYDNNKQTNLTTTNELIVRLNLQSPGIIELSKLGSKGIVLIALILASCGNPESAATKKANEVLQNKEIISIVDSNNIEIQKLRDTFNELKGDANNIIRDLK